MRISDWSSGVCSSDLLQRVEPGMKGMRGTGNDKASWPLAPRRSMWRGSLGVTAWLRPRLLIPYSDRKSVVAGKSVSVRVDLGGRRIIKKKRLQTHISCNQHQIIHYIHKRHTHS